jgi:adenine-specific DNA methylase
MSNFYSNSNELYNKYLKKCQEVKEKCIQMIINGECTKDSANKLYQTERNNLLDNLYAETGI